MSTNPLPHRVESSTRTDRRRTTPGQRERGMVLIVVLIMLTVLTLLSVTTMGNTGMEEKMATNAQEYNRAFQAAESGISSSMKLKSILDSTATEGAPVTNNFSFRSGKETAVTESWYDVMGREAPPGYSMGGSFRAHYFTMKSTAASSGGGNALHNQGYYVIGPGT